MAASTDIPVIAFKSAAAWRTWLKKNYSKSNGIWLHTFKKDSGKPTVTHLEAVDEALCFGWIDSVRRGFDDESYLQKFGPRKTRSVWSKVNRDNVARLIKAGKMDAAGLLAVEAAKANGQWEQAYSAANFSVPAELQALLDKHPKARAFFESLNKVNRYTFCLRVQSPVKAETRQKKAQWALELLLRGEKIH